MGVIAVFVWTVGDLVTGVILGLLFLAWLFIQFCDWWNDHYGP